MNGIALEPDGTLSTPTGPAPGFFEYLPSFFQLPGFTWAHLWFLVYLYVFTLLYLPALRRIDARPATWQHAGNAWAWAPIVPLVAIQVLLRPRWPGLQNLYDDWANFALYSTLLVLGFLFARQPALERAAHRQWKPLGAVGLAACGAMALRREGLIASPAAVGHALSGVAAWGCVAGLLGFGARYLTRGGRVFRYLRECSFPVYVLHSPAIVLCAHFIERLDWAVPAKFAAILAGAVVLMLAAYEGAGRVAVLRVLLGTKPRPVRTVAGLRAATAR